MDTLKEIALAVHALAIEKGWHDEKETEDHFIERTCNNIHNEVSELHEAWRNGELHEWCDKAENMKKLGIEPLTCLEEELADIIIRALDSSMKLKIDILSAIKRKHQYNQTRSYRHGNKKS